MVRKWVTRGLEKINVKCLSLLLGIGKPLKVFVCLLACFCM